MSSSTTLDAKPSFDTIDVGSTLSMGTAPIGHLFEKRSWSESLAAVRYAVQHGVRFFDTAPLYGLGLAEELLSEAFKDQCTSDGIGASLSIASKVGRVVVTEEEFLQRQQPNADREDVTWFYKVDNRGCSLFDYSAAGFVESFDASVARLGRPVDCLRVHDAETAWRFESLTCGRGVERLVQLRDEGKLKQVSLGMNNAAFALKLLNHYPAGTFDNVLLAGMWNLLDQSGYDVLCQCQTLGIDVEIAGIFGSGLLWGGEHYKYLKATQRNKAQAVLWQELCQQHNVALPTVALAFAYQPAVVSRCVIGMATVKEVAENVALCNQVGSVTNQFWNDAFDKQLLPLKLKQLFNNNNTNNTNNNNDDK